MGNRIVRRITGASKKVPLGAIPDLIQRLRRRKCKVVFTNGCFDLIHSGHIRYLKKARLLGDVLIVGINSDHSVRKLKGKCRPIINEKDRMEIVAALEMVDYVVVFNETTPERVIRLIRPDVHVKGGDYVKKNIPEAVLVREWGGVVVVVPFVKGKSTTQLIQTIKGLSV